MTGFKAEQFTPLWADMNWLIASGKHGVEIPNFPGGAEGIRGLAAGIEAVTPAMYKGKFDLVWRLDNVRERMLNLLRSWAVKIKKEMARPTANWEHKPEIKAGMPGKSGKIPVGLTRGYPEVHTGAFVSASGQHSPWIHNRAVTQNDANWHYIWTDQGTGNRHATPTKGVGWLKYNDHYSPSTTPGSLESGLATRPGNMRRAKQTNSSVKARGFVEVIANEQTGPFQAACMNAIITALTQYNTSLAANETRAKKVLGA